MNYQDLSTEELVRECAERPNNEAWAEFRKRFNRLIAGVVIKCCIEWGDSSPATVEDVIQDVYTKLCDNSSALLKNFVSRHPDAFLGYLKMIAASVAYDHFRGEHAEKRDVKNTVGLDEAANQVHGSYGTSKDAEMVILLNEINRLLRQRFTQKEITIFWLYYRQGLTSKEIASIPSINLTVKGVESVIFRMTSYVKRSLAEKPDSQATTGIQV
jgi:RNA polymerase sigma factor (sigma-70 family)